MTKIYKLGRMYLIQGNDYVPELRLSSNNLYEGINKKVGRFLYRERHITSLKDLEIKEQALRIKYQSLNIPLTSLVEKELKSITHDYNQVMWINETYTEVINLLVSTYGVEELHLEGLNNIKNSIDNAMDFQDNEVIPIWESLSTQDKSVLNLLGINSFSTFWSSDFSCKMMVIFNWPLIPGRTCDGGDVDFYKVSMSDIWNGEELITQSA